jgi:phosphomannomutase
MFQRAVVSVLESIGVNIIDVGLSSTPTIQLAVESHHAQGGLAITASHNPVEWNALKFIGPSGLFLDASQGGEMRALLGGPFARASWDRLGEVRSDPDAAARHLTAILELPHLDVAAIRALRLRVAVDYCRGAGAPILEPLLEALGCDVSRINEEPDGRFPRSPEPVAANLGELEQLVSRTGSQVGFAVDPDVDRLALVADDGKVLGEDYTLALAARVVLSRGAGQGPVVTNLSTSRVVDDVAAAFGRNVIRAPVGEVNVAVKMRELGASVGGEGNGGVILPDLHLGRDAPLAAALILMLMAHERRSLRAVVGDYPRYVIVKDKMERSPGSLLAVYDALRKEHAGAEVDEQDGLRLSWSDRWVHVRPSGTEPIVRVIAEGSTEEVACKLIESCRAPLERLGSEHKGE